MIRLSASTVVAILVTTFSAGVSAQTTKTFDEAATALQTDVIKNCAKGYNKKKFKLATITDAYPESNGGLHSVVLLDADSEFAPEFDTLRFLRSKASVAQAKTLIGKQKCMSL